MTPPTTNRSSYDRPAIPAATEAALWVHSNGTCYSPGCTQPVIVELRPGVLRKNVQIAHIYGVRPGAPRYVSADTMPVDVRDSFRNLLLLCYPHHGEIDDIRTGEKLYPAVMLHEWKERKEGEDADALAALGKINDDELERLLTSLFQTPLDRLEAITERLEATGEVNVQTVQELWQIIEVMSNSDAGINLRTVQSLEVVAEVFSTLNLAAAAQQLSAAAEILPGILPNLQAVAKRLSDYG